jgi:hypothetical protein
MTEIHAEADVPGFLPVKEVVEEANKQGWQASLTERGTERCPVHREKK